MLELARVLGELAREGYRPRRTIVFASWDAEEYTLTGSTEWGEEHADFLRQNGVACLNVDSAASGANFSVSASPLLRHLIIEAAQAVEAPQTGKPVYEHWVKSSAEANVRSYISGITLAAGPSIGRLGSGSDYTVFFNHLGIPALDMTFDGPYGVYHSVYDNFYWMEYFGDPGFRSHATIARLWGVVALRLANADLLPFDVAAYADAIGTYVEELKSKTEPQFFADHLAPIQKEAQRLSREASSAESGWQRWLAEPQAHAAALARANQILLQIERHLTHPDGIPGRPWFKHLLYAPQPSYHALTLPGIREEPNGRTGSEQPSRRSASSRPLRSSDNSSSRPTSSA